MPEGIGDRITKIFLDSGLTAQKFCDIIGVGHPSFSMYRREYRPPSFYFVYSLSKEFNVSLDWLIFGEGKPYKTEDKNEC